MTFSRNWTTWVYTWAYTLLVCAGMARAGLYLVTCDAELTTVDCSPEYENETDHTMCLTDLPNVVWWGMSESNKQSVVQLHNCLRSIVDPPSSDMLKVVWDDKLAAVAQKWAKQCKFAHDRNRVIPSYGVDVGQNVAVGFDSWYDAILAWFDESKMFRYGEDPSIYLGGPDAWRQIGHYTQMVQNHVDRIGCGFAKCEGTEHTLHYVCNYGQGQHSIEEPYTIGEWCAQCPDSCNNRLCDCGGKMCQNMGHLDANSCTCVCSKIYEGDTCEKLVCPSEDSESCWKIMKPEHCPLYINVQELCPYMCGICGGPDNATPPPIFVSSYNCTFMGPRPSKTECQQFGEYGADTRYCASKGGHITCQHCDNHSNVKTDFCPVMCGYCDPIPVPVYVSSFNCTYEGFRPPKLECQKYGDSGSDKQHCASQGGVYGCKYCDLYNNFKTDHCPIMCGFCEE